MMGGRGGQSSTSTVQGPSANDPTTSGCLALVSQLGKVATGFQPKSPKVPALWVVRTTMSQSHTCVYDHPVTVHLRLDYATLQGYRTISFLQCPPLPSNESLEISHLSNCSISIPTIIPIHHLDSDSFTPSASSSKPRCQQPLSKYLLHQSRCRPHAPPLTISIPNNPMVIGPYRPTSI